MAQILLLCHLECVTFDAGAGGNEVNEVFDGFFREAEAGVP
jgi:hypothetical protein